MANFLHARETRLPKLRGPKPVQAMTHQNPSPLPEPHELKQKGDHPLSAGAHSTEGSRTPNNVREGRRVEFKGVGKAALGAGLGVGLAVGLSEGIPAILGGQGPFSAALNPKKEPGTPGGPEQSFFEKLFGNDASSPLVFIAIAGVVILLVLKHKG